MIGVRRGLGVALLGLLVLLLVLPGVGGPGVVTGLVCAAVLAVATARRAVLEQVETFGPADLVTVTRAVLACGVAALVTSSFVTGAEVVPVLVPLTAVALVLDFVDGRVARRTGTASVFGARLDGEADAFLVLVLSVHVAASYGSWVLAVGLVRYAYAVATWLLPWMRRQLPPRYWRKVVAAFVGMALLLAASGWAHAGATYAVLVAACVLLTESFGRDVVWLWRRRPARVNRSRGRAVLLDTTLERDFERNFERNR